MRFFSRFRKPAETPIPRKDEFLEAMSQTSAIAWFDHSAKVIEANQIFCDMTGYAQEQVIGMDHDAFVAPELRKTDADAAFFKALRDEELIPATVPRLNKDGMLIWLHTTYVPMRTETGKLERLAVVAKDVTESYQKIRDQLEQFDSISDRQAKIVFDLKGNILHANENFLKTMG